MNRKQRRIAQSQGNYKPVIHWRGRAYTIDEASLLAMKEHRLKNLQAAADIYRLILTKVPDYADAYNNQSVVLHEIGLYEDALASCDKAIALKPDFVAAWYNRGNSLHALERLSEALASYDKVIAIKPDYPEIYNNRGIILQEMKRYDDALASYDKAIEIKPDYAAAWYNRSVTLLALKRYDEVLASCDRAIALKPDYAEAHNSRCVSLRSMKRYNEALASGDKAIALNPDYAVFHFNRGITLQEMNRYNDALASYDKTVALKPDYAEAHNNRGAILQELRLYDAALVSCTKALELQPDNAEACNNLGVIFLNKGNMQEAERMFLKALALKPDFTIPMFSLTNIRKYRDVNHADVKTIQMLLNKPAESLRSKEYLYFSLGKIYDDCGRYDDAFECYRQANQILNREVSYSPAGVTEITSSIIDVFSKDFLSQPFVSQSRQPLFIVGMPRSGTTLMASILSNHRSIGTAGELRTIAEFIVRLPQLSENGTPYPQAVKYITPAIVARLVDEYEKRLRRDVGMDALYIIDKHPHNFRHLGFISMLFPKARIIHCTRYPLDTCLSNYFQRFSLDYDYSFDLRNTGHFYGEYAKIMEHWQQILPMKMIEISYEDMILNTEQVARKALDFLGLEWDERCLSPHTNPCPVETASRWQVRQPIYTQSVERWRHYDKHLAPLKEMLRLSGRIFN